MYGHQEDQAMLKSLRKVTEVETDFEYAKKEWFKKMGICEFCEAQCGWDDSDYGSIDALEEDFDLQAFEFGRVWLQRWTFLTVLWMWEGLDDKVASEDFLVLISHKQNIATSLQELNFLQPNLGALKSKFKQNESRLVCFFHLSAYSSEGN